MKKRIRNLLILLTPFMVMVLLNEIVRGTSNEPAYKMGAITTMNSNLQMESRCSWSCHNNTTYCKEHHVKLLRPYFQYFDILYFGLIGLLKSTGSYGLANLVFLVCALPLIMFYLLVRSIDLQIEISETKKPI